MAKERHTGTRDVAVSAAELSGPGDAPQPLAQPFSLGERLDHMAGHPDLDAAHRRWETFGAGTGGDSGTVLRRYLHRLASRVVPREPTIGHHHALLSELTRIVDALAKRCDELERRLELLNDHVGELCAQLSEDLARLTALAATRTDDAPQQGE